MKYDFWAFLAFLCVLAKAPSAAKLLLFFEPSVERAILEWHDRRVAKDIRANGIKRRRPPC